MSGSWVPKIYGTQIGLKNPAHVDEIKAAMRAGRFGYEGFDERIGGIRVAPDAYYVKEGHHRTVAALELYQETGDATAVRELIRCGRWSDQERPPIDARPMPSRQWWAAFRNWIGF